MDLSLIRIFICVYENKNISKAAEILNLSQPSVTYNLNRLRKHLNDPLFERTQYGVEATKLSHELYSEDIAELRKQQINCIVSDGNTNYFIDQITSYKKKSKLSLGNVVKTIQYLQVLIPAKLKPYLQKKETDPAITTNAMNELQEILKPYKVNVNSKDAIFKTVVIKQSFNDNVLQLLLRLNPAGTTEKIEVPIIVEG